MVDIKSRFIDSKLPLFSGLASNNSPEFLEAADYQAFLANYQVDPSRSDLPSYDEILVALNEGIDTSDWHHAEELQQKILKSVVCSGSPTQVSRFFGPEADNISSLCSAMTSRVVASPVAHVSRPSHRGPTVRGVATVGGIVVGIGTVWWGGRAATAWASRNAGRLSNHPFWQRFVTQAAQGPVYYGPEIPRFFSRSGLVIRGGRLASFVRTGAATRFLGYMTMAGWADNATVRLLDLREGNLSRTGSSLFWYYHGYRMALSPEKSFLIRVVKFGGREGLAVVERNSPRAAAALAGAVGRVGAGQLLGKTARGMGKLVVADTVGAMVFKAGNWMFEAEPVLDMEDDAVYRLMQQQTSENSPYTAWLANSIRWVDRTFMRWTYENINRIDKKELYKYLRHQDRLTRVGSYFAEQAAVAAASAETVSRTVDYQYLQFLVENPKADPFLQSALRQLLANPVSHEGGWLKQDAGTFNLPDVSKFLSDAIVLDQTSNTLKVKEGWAFKRWVDSLPVPVRAKGTFGFDEMMERQFHPTPIVGDEIGEKGRRSQGLPLTFGQLYDSAAMLDEKISASPEILEIADLLKQGKKPEQGKYSEESVYLAKEFVHSNE
ncbi:MAG: hypothetical protein Q7S98_04995, partial [Deltaproteobacteria bacterium]|nr:hypothetical protein [Deltaproteobacteria bacterium]